MSNAIAPYQYLNAQGVETSQLINTDKPSQFLYIPESEFVVNPFPNHILNLIQPLDSMSRAKGVLGINYDDIRNNFMQVYVALEDQNLGHGGMRIIQYHKTILEHYDTTNTHLNHKRACSRDDLLSVRPI